MSTISAVEGMDTPISHAFTELLVTFSFLAKAVCVRLFCSRRNLILSATMGYSPLYDNNRIIKMILHYQKDIII
jgi:hypothetical protein